jgi:serine/threonine-protein kinase
VTAFPPLDPRHWQRVQALFQEAISLPVERRASHVTESEGDPAIRAAVIAMLDADLDPASILDGSAEQHLAGSTDDATATPDRMIGTEVGTYRVLERLGHGGMGTVYLAEHRELKHQVALKVIRNGMVSAAIVRRFAQERQIVASLAHPNVARLFDGGLTGDGQPWFSMELVTGEPIDRHCERRNLPLRRRLELLATVCDAVQYAHARLVVHRDLKPGNIMVSDAGEPKLLDFGIAKLLTDDGADIELTQSGVRPMSPAHAAPEQILGEPITTATDVYALGVVLYEMLTRSRPYGDELTGRALEEAILSATPSRPMAGMQRSDRFASDLDNIVLMALRKEPDRRYPGAGALADDIRRLLSGHPVTATRDSAGYRLAKFVGRNRAAVTAATVGLLVTSASVGWYTVQLRDERAVAEREAATAAQVSEFLQGIFVAPNQLVFSSGAGTAPVDATPGELLSAAVERLRADSAMRPDTKLPLLNALGSTYRSMGEYRAAVSIFALADSTLAQIAEPVPMLEVQVASGLGSAYWETGDLANALVNHQLAHERISAIPSSGPFARAVVANDLALVLWQMGRLADAEPYMAESIELFREAGDGEDNAGVGTSMANHALVLRELGRIDEAESRYREAIAITQRTLGPDHASLANSVGQLATLLLQDRGDAEGALALTLEGLRIRRAALGERHPYVAVSINELAAAYRAAGRRDDAERTYREALALRREVLEAGHPHIAYSLTGLGELLIDLDRAGEALPLMEEAIAIREAALPADHWLLADTRSRLGRTLALVGRTNEAAPLLEEGHATIVAAFGADDRRSREAAERLESLAAP